MTNSWLFEEILGRFLPGFAGEEMKTLAREWRDILFRLKMKMARGGSRESSPVSSDESDGAAHDEEDPDYVIPRRKTDKVTRHLTDWDAYVRMRDAAYRSLQS